MSKSKSPFFSGVRGKALPQALIVILAGSALGGAATITVDATQNGCSQCNSVFNVLPGTVLSIYNPKAQLVLAAGTYTITNAAITGQFSGWNFQGNSQLTGNTPNWVWGFIAADDSTGKVLLDDYITGVYATQSLAATATGIQTFNGTTLLSGNSTSGFTDTLTLTTTTTLDFLVDDYYLPDNAGGVRLKVVPQSTSASPEPGSQSMFALAFLGGVLVWRRPKAFAGIRSFLVRTSVGLGKSAETRGSAVIRRSAILTSRVAR